MILEYWYLPGVADGANVPYLSILSMNVRTEIAFGMARDGCTTVYWKTDRSSFLAQNWVRIRRLSNNSLPPETGTWVKRNVARERGSLASRTWIWIPIFSSEKQYWVWIVDRTGRRSKNRTSSTSTLARTESQLSAWSRKLELLGKSAWTPKASVSV